MKTNKKNSIFCLIAASTITFNSYHVPTNTDTVLRQVRVTLGQAHLEHPENISPAELDRAVRIICQKTTEKLLASFDDVVAFYREQAAGKRKVETETIKTLQEEKTTLETEVKKTQQDAANALINVVKQALFKCNENLKNILKKMERELPDETKIDELFGKRSGDADAAIKKIIDDFENNKNLYKSSVLMVMSILSGITGNSAVTKVLDKALEDLNGQPSKYSRVVILDRTTLGRKYGFRQDEIKRRFKAQINQITTQLQTAIKSPIQSLKGLQPPAASSTQS